MLMTIEGFEDYGITENGEVWSFKRKKWLKARKHKYGYLQVVLYKDGKSYSKLIHRLVAEAFLPRTKEDIKLERNCVDHRDGNPKNNNINNLRWCTRAENNNFELALENRKKAANRPDVKEKKSKANKITMNKPETKAKISKANSKPIIIDGADYKSATEASKILGIKQQTIQYRLKSKKFENYKYKNDNPNLGTQRQRAELRFESS